MRHQQPTREPLRETVVGVACRCMRDLRVERLGEPENPVQEVGALQHLVSDEASRDPQADAREVLVLQDWSIRRALCPFNHAKVFARLVPHLSRGA